MEVSRVSQDFALEPSEYNASQTAMPCPPARVWDLMRSSRRHCRDVVLNTARVPHMTDSLNRWHPIAERLLQHLDALASYLARNTKAKSAN